jgi:hypothetical protein
MYEHAARPGTVTSDEEVVARITAGLWTDGWIGTRAIGREQAARAYVPGEDVDRVIEVVEAATSNPDCPIRDDFEGAEYWPPCWAVVYDPERVRQWILQHDEEILPLDLEE